MGERVKKDRVEFRLEQGRLLETNVKEVKQIFRLMVLIVRLQKGADLETLMEIESKLDVATGFLAKFVWRGNGYLSMEEALPIVEELSIGQVFQGLTMVAGTLKDVAVPPVNGGTSDSD